MASVAKRKWIYNGVTKEAWAVRYFDEKGVRRSKTFDQKKAADTFKRKVEREMDDGVHVADNASRTVAEAGKALLGQFSDRLAAGEIGQSHYANAEGTYRLYVAPRLGSILLRDLTTDHVLNFSQVLRREGQKPASVRKYLAFLRLMEKHAKKRGWLKTQPVADALTELPRAPAERIATFRPDEVGLLLTRAGDVRWRHRPASMLNVVVHLAALCGLRMGEIIGLPLDAVDLTRRQLTVRQAASRFYEIKGPKTEAGNRTVPIPARVATLLQDWIDKHYIENPDGLIICGPRGLIVRQGNLRVQWNALLDACDLPRRHFHALRHFYSSWHMMNGTPAADVAKLLGHAHFDMTLRVYTHALLEADACTAQADRIAGLLIPADARATQTPLNH